MARLLTVIITAIAWFLISNHCVLAERATCSATKASCHQPCCGDRPPAKNKTENATECCKTLRATLIGAAKDFAGYDSSLFALQLYFVGPIISTDILARQAPVSLNWTPARRSCSTFAESVLQRSILAHAPPLLVNDSLPAAAGFIVVVAAWPCRPLRESATFSRFASKALQGRINLVNVEIKNQINIFMTEQKNRDTRNGATQQSLPLPPRLLRCLLSLQARKKLAL